MKRNSLAVAALAAIAGVAGIGSLPVDHRSIARDAFYRRNLRGPNRGLNHQRRPAKVRAQRRTARKARKLNARGW